MAPCEGVVGSKSPNFVSELAGDSRPEDEIAEESPTAARRNGNMRGESRLLSSEGRRARVRPHHGEKWQFACGGTGAHGWGSDSTICGVAVAVMGGAKLNGSGGVAVNETEHSTQSFISMYEQRIRYVNYVAVREREGGLGDGSPYRPRAKLVEREGDDQQQRQ